MTRQFAPFTIARSTSERLTRQLRIENLDGFIRWTQAKRAELYRRRNRYRRALEHVYIDPGQRSWGYLPALKPFNCNFFAQVSTRFPREIRDHVFAHVWTEDQLRKHHVRVSRALRGTKKLDSTPLLDQRYVGSQMALEMLEAYHKAVRLHLQYAPIAMSPVEFKHSVIEHSPLGLSPPIFEPGNFLRVLDVRIVFEDNTIGSYCYHYHGLLSTSTRSASREFTNSNTRRN